jgi:hypothetical protein
MNDLCEAVEVKVGFILCVVECPRRLIGGHGREEHGSEDVLRCGGEGGADERRM